MTNGATVFAALSRALAAADERAVKNALAKGVRDAAKPLLPVATQAVVDVSPKAGGMAERETQVVFRPRTSTGPRSAAISIVADKKWVAARTLNRVGRFRHPVNAWAGKTGKDRKWGTQNIPGAQGFLARALDPHAPAVRSEIDRAVIELLEKIARDSRA